jgi:hypothetical protein
MDIADRLNGDNMIARSGKIAFATGALCVVATLSVSAADSRVAVKWPQGWTVRQAPLPAYGPAGPRPDIMQTAVKSQPDGSPLAAISLTSVAIRPDHPVQFDQEAEAMLHTIETGYIDKGFKASCGALVKTTLGTLSALQSMCQVESAKNVPLVKQMVIVAAGVDEVFNLTYTAPPANFDTYKNDFVQVAGSLRVRGVSPIP